MNLSPEVKKQAFKDHGKSEFDTGSTEAQVALFTMKIQHLTEHLKSNKKDLMTERSLVRLVGKTTEIERYRSIIKKLNIRK
jgi:small subunit ribosomal protein S15